MFSAYVSTEYNNNLENIKATTCNCVVVAHLTKLAISIFLGKIEGNLGFLLTIYPRKLHNFVICSSDFDEIFTDSLVLHYLFRYSH